MDAQGLFNLVYGSAIAAIGWFARHIFSEQISLRREINKIERDHAILYVRKEEFFEQMRRLEDKLDKIYDKLDSKQDK